MIILLSENPHAFLAEDLWDTSVQALKQLRAIDPQGNRRDVVQQGASRQVELVEL
jgi:hypothetical protein